jgi:hypothetical protein
MQMEEVGEVRRQGGCHPLFNRTITTRNSLIHDGLLSSQTRENASQLTHDDDRKKRHVSHVIHLLEADGPSQIDFFVHHG